ncbi:MAG: transposase [Patescibacteria group bacterium]
MQYTGKLSQRGSKRSNKYHALPIKLTEKEFNVFFLPFLSLPRRSRKFKVPLWQILNYILYQLHTGCQWENVPIKIDPATGKKEINHTAIWKWFNRWSGDGSFDRAFTGSVRLLHEKKKLLTKRINIDGTNSIAKKGAKTLGILVTSIKQGRRLLA